MTDWRARKRTNILLLAIAAALVLCLIQLGNWQMRRLDWKNALIEAVESRAFGLPVDAPTAVEWADIAAESHAYLRVRADGRLRHDREIAVKAVTEIGPGYWIMTPLLRDNGEFIWINRGFVPSDLRRPETRGEPTGDTVSVTGLLRIPEPGGTLLQSNDPAADRWYSRDVEAFSLHRELPAPAPYFIDADHAGSSVEWPRGGMTKTDFRNTHLQYALTWYALAVLLAAGMGYLVWLSRRPPAEDGE